MTPEEKAQTEKERINNAFIVRWTIIIFLLLLPYILGSKPFKVESKPYQSTSDQLMIQRIKAQGFNSSEADTIYNSAKTICKASNGNDC